MTYLLGNNAHLPVGNFCKGAKAGALLASFGFKPPIAYVGECDVQQIQNVKGWWGIIL